jgi:integrase
MQHKSSLREKTAHQYKSTITKHIVPFLGGVTLKELCLLGVENYYSTLQSRGVGIRTIQIIHNILHAALDKSVRYGMLERNPTQGATLPVYRFDEMQVLSKEQVRKFLGAASQSSSHTIFHLALVTGMRMGELLGLKWSDIDWEAGTITVQRQKQYVPGVGWSLVEPKTRYGRRTIKVGENTLRNLQLHQQDVTELSRKVNNRWTDMNLVFPNSVGKPGDASNIRLEFNRVLEQAEIPKIRFHDLRHTAASILLNHQIPVIVVSRILGHSRPSVTLDLYGHLLCDMQDEAALVMEKVVNL